MRRAFVPAAPLPARAARPLPVCASRPRARVARSSSGRRRAAAAAPWRAALYPDVDPPERVPNPLEGADAERRARGEAKGAPQEEEETPRAEDALGKDVLQRARRLFGDVDQDEARRTRVDEAEETRSDGGSESASSSGGVGSWFGFGRRKSSQEMEQAQEREQEQAQEQLRTPSPSRSDSLQSSAQSSVSGGADASWPPDEVDVAAAEGRIRDAQGLAGAGNGSGNGDLSAANASVEAEAESGIDIQRASRAFWKVGWWTWWIQLVLTTISGVIVLFAFAFPGVNIRSTASASGFVCAGAGVAIAFMSLLWTYGYTRLAVRLRRAQPKWIKNAPDRVASYLRMGIVLALSGMFVSLIGLQAIVGTLLARLFGAGIATTPYTALQAGAVNTAANAAVLGGLGSVQPVDVLVIQASANAMSALLTALVAGIWFRGRLLRFWTRKQV